MRIKKLFAIPDGEKVTEKALRRVLISSVCSILLCMTCLVSTTWAWFTVSIENTDNVIAIGKPSVVVNDGQMQSGSQLTQGTHVINITHANNPDDLQKKSTLHVTFSVDSVVAGRIVLNAENAYETKITVETDKTCVLTWDVSWFAPEGAEELTKNTISLITEEPTDPPTEPPAEETTEPSTEATTEPSTDTTAPTEATAEPPAEETTIPITEATEAATEATTAPALTGETTIPAADETTAPASMPTNATEPVTEPDGTTAPAETE